MTIINRILPELRQAYSEFPGFRLEEDLTWSRGLLSNPPSKKSEDVLTTNCMIPRGDGDEMLVKIYEPAKREQDKLPAMLWIHGGGFVMGHPDMDDVLCERFVETANCVVVSIDYVTRLAQAGVDVEFHLYPGSYHCFEVFVPEVKVSQQAIQNYLDAMARALNF